MLRLPTLTYADWAAGTLSNTAIDEVVSVFPDGTPALIPARVIAAWLTQSGVLAVGAQQPAAQIPTPIASTPTFAAHAGGVANSTSVAYRVAALDASGTTLASGEVSASAPATGGPWYPTVSWSAPAVPRGGQPISGYNVYGRTVGAELLLTPTPLGAGVTSFTDTNTVTPSGALPSANTTSPYPTISKSNTYGNGAAQWAGLGATAALTPNPGDTLTIPVPAGVLQVNLQLAGYVAAGAGFTSGDGTPANGIRNGAKAQVQVDGTTLALVDLYSATPLVQLLLDGLPHTVTLTHTGQLNPACQPISAVSATTGSSLTSSSVAISSLAAASAAFVSATWQVRATGAATYDLYKQPQGGGAFSKVNVAALGTATAYSGAAYVPGCVLQVSGTLTTGDVAQFTTDQTMIALTQLAYGTGTGSGTATWLGPVLDLHDPAAVVYGLEWVESVPPQSVILGRGNTPTPDGTWSYSSMTLGDTAAAAALPAGAGGVCSDGNRYGTAGGVVTRGRYAQVQLTLAGVSLVQPQVSHLALYGWVPETDPVMARIMAQINTGLGPNWIGYLGGLCSWFADVRQAVIDLDNGYALSTASGAYAQGYLTDVGLAPVTGEGAATTAARARAGLCASYGQMNVSSPTGAFSAFTSNVPAPYPGCPSSYGALSVPTIAWLVAQLVNGRSATDPTLGVALSGTPAATTAVCGGVTVARQADSTYKVTIPAPGAAGYPGYPGFIIGPAGTAGTAQWAITQFVQQIRPAGSSPTIVFN